jgi:dihydrofolate reductase
VLASEIDRLILKVNPLVLGDGIPMIDGGYDPGDFELVDSSRYESGVLVNEYVRRR